MSTSLLNACARSSFILLVNVCVTFTVGLMEFSTLVTASMARKIYLREGLGVGAFRRIYGGSKRNGSRPPHFCKSSGAIARHILQQWQNMNIVEIDTKG